MAAATLSEKGQIVIPLEIRVTPTVPEAGFGLVRATPGRKGAGRKLSDFDAASLVRKKGSA